MNKKLFLLLFFFFPLLITAQTLIGSWKYHSPYSTVNSIVETPQKVYFMSKGSLFSYDKDTDESYAYSPDNLLNDTDVNGIYYNAKSKYLLVTYANGNMDFLYDDGSVANMSDIKDAVLTSRKTIHGVSFVDKDIYIAAEFGIVLVDEASHTVKQSGIFNKKINSFTKIGDHYVIAHDDGIFAAKDNSRINNIGNFTLIDSTPVYEVLPLEGENKAIIRPEKNIKKVTFDFEGKKMNVESAFGAEYAYTEHGNPYADGYYFTNRMMIAMTSPDGETTSLKWIPGNNKLYLNPMAIWDGPEYIWTSNFEGVARVHWEDNNEFVYLTDYFIPSHFMVRPVDVLKKDNFGRVFATTLGMVRRVGNVYQPSDDEPYRKSTNINYFDAEGNMLKFDPDNMLNPYSTNRNTAYEPKKGSGKLCLGLSLTVHPKNPDILFMGNRYDGLYRLSLKDGCQYLYGADNSKIFWDGWQSYVGFVDFDRHGNLWVSQYVNDTKFDKNTNLLMLPASKVDSPTTTPDDWEAIETPLIIGLDPMVTACKNSNIVCLYSSNYVDQGGIVFYDTRGTETTGDDRMEYYKSYIDQDGKQFSPLYINCVVEVENGRLWVGTDDGVFEIANPESMLREGRINRIKVPRNDGTGLADYLMGSQAVSAIAMDASKNKWIATLEGGVFQVSADGRTILRNFTTDNSPLSTNRVLSVECSPVSNIVYIGTEDGLYEYQSDSAPARPDYSEVIAYPNPVRPDYTGWITIKGLMENSLVKIADSAGNVVSQGTSEGGMYTWDGCNFNGEPVRTGVYFVYASQSGDAGNNAAVTKIMIVR